MHTSLILFLNLIIVNFSSTPAFQAWKRPRRRYTDTERAVGRTFLFDATRSQLDALSLEHLFCGTDRCNLVVEPCETLEASDIQKPPATSDTSKRLLCLKLAHATGMVQAPQSVPISGRFDSITLDSSLLVDPATEHWSFIPDLMELSLRGHVSDMMNARFLAESSDIHFDLQTMPLMERKEDMLTDGLLQMLQRITGIL